MIPNITRITLNDLTQSSLSVFWLNDGTLVEFVGNDLDGVDTEDIRAVFKMPDELGENNLALYRGTLGAIIVRFNIIGAT